MGGEPQEILAQSNPGYGTLQILRPYADFEDVYQGVATTTPIMFTLGGAIRDPQAGLTGYDPQLVKGLPIALGQRCLIWLPAMTPAAPSDADSYRWRFMWRYRNAHDYRTVRLPFHLAKQSAGVPDAGSARVVLPAAYVGAVYNPTEPTDPNVGVSASLRVQDISPRQGGGTSSISRPLNAVGVSGVVQQGVFDPAINTLFADLPAFIQYDLVATGDELLVGLWRTGVAPATANWGFQNLQSDRIVTLLFGDGSGQTFPEIGVYVALGTGP